MNASVFYEELTSKTLYSYDDVCDAPAEPHRIPLGQANVRRRGDDVTIVALGRMVGVAEQAADEVRAQGIGCTIVDPRTISPLDETTILDSVRSTGRLVVVDEGHPRCGMASDIAAIVARQAFGDSKAPVSWVSAPHTPVPFAADLEAMYVPTVADVRRAVVDAVNYS